MTVNQLPAIAGRITRAPSLKFTAKGTAMARFSIASSVRQKNPAGEWEDGPATFITCTAWERTAEHLAESDLHPGDPVIVSGPLELREWTTDTGEKRRDLELTARHVAVDLHRFPITARRVDRHDQAVAAGKDERRQQAAAVDPWAAQQAGPAPW